jgi:hypothetical protein
MELSYKRLDLCDADRSGLTFALNDDRDRVQANLPAQYDVQLPDSPGTTDNFLVARDRASPAVSVWISEMSCSKSFQSLDITKREDCLAWRLPTN